MTFTELCPTCLRKVRTIHTCFSAEDELIEYVRNNRRISIFFITRTDKMARLFNRLQKEGKIIRQMDDPYDRYPVCVFSVPEVDQ